MTNVRKAALYITKALLISSVIRMHIQELGVQLEILCCSKFGTEVLIKIGYPKVEFLFSSFLAFWLCSLLK